MKGRREGGKKEGREERKKEGILIKTEYYHHSRKVLS
jgi:hypothetical protein